MEIIKVPRSELESRMTRFLHEMDRSYDSWEMCAITGATGLFYFTGTICDGVLFIRREKDEILWVRRSYERALLESEFPDIRKMSSFRNVAEYVGDISETLYLDTAFATLEWYSMLHKYLPFKNVLSNEKALLYVRSVKSDYELERMSIAGSTVNRLLLDEFSSYVHEGISEAVLGGRMFRLFVENGHQGVTRFNMRNSGEILGHVAFGDGSMFPSTFNGASGVGGFYPATPALGRYNRYLNVGDLIYIDVCFGYDGYNIDKTLIYSYKTKPAEYLVAAHEHCMMLEKHAASLLRPGNTPAEV